MKIIAIRHSAVIENSICYGQADIPLDESLFASQCHQVLSQLQKQPLASFRLISSPSIRCQRLALAIRNKLSIADFGLHDQLLEMNFGHWQNKPWQDISKHEIDAWVENLLDFNGWQGESVNNFYERVADFYQSLIRTQKKSFILVTHAGVIRALFHIINGVEKELSTRIDVENAKAYTFVK